MIEPTCPQLDALVERHSDLRRAAKSGREQYEAFEREQARALLRAQENIAAMERLPRPAPVSPKADGRPTIDTAFMNRKPRIGDGKRTGLYQMIADIARGS